MRKLFMILCVVALSFGCNDDKTEGGDSQTNATLSISGEQMVFSVGGDVIGGESAITVTSSSNWRLLGDKTWCTPSVTEGANGSKVTFAAAPNIETEPRSATYTFVCGDKAMKMVVTQKQSAVLDVISEKKIDVTSGAGTFTIRAVGNSDISYEIPENSKNWILPQGGVSRAIGGIFLSFNVKANDTYEDRVGAVVVKVDGLETAIEINQKQNDAVVLTKDTYEAPIEGGQITIAFNSNIEYRVSIDSKYNWITPILSRALVPGQVAFNVAVGAGTRIGQVKFTSTGGQLLATAFISQYGVNRVYAEIPDAVFRNWLQSNDYIIVPATGVKCELTEAGLTAKTFNCNNKAIASFEGIDKFPAITSFNCSSTKVTELDLSKLAALETLSCSNMSGLKSVVLNPTLTTLTCSSNALLASLDISKCAALTTMTCNSNTTLTSLDLSKCIALTTLTCNANSKLASLDISKCSALTTLTCSSNALLTDMNLSGKTALTTVSFNSSDKLKSIDVSNCTALTKLTFTATGVKTLNTTGATALKEITCNGSAIEAFDLSTNIALTKLVAYTTKITTLDVSYNTALSYLDCETNPQLLTLYKANGQSIITFYKDSGLQIIEKE